MLIWWMMRYIFLKTKFPFENIFIFISIHTVIHHSMGSPSPQTRLTLCTVVRVPDVDPYSSLLTIILMVIKYNKKF